MGKVHVLSDDLISLISAGEVIENPASIVKELIENSLDAHATFIDIEIRSGGIDTIIVSDDGVGIQKEDVPVCIQRHSTSKLRTKEDMDSILTYGFRGEALASIAAVAEVKILTCSSDEELGTQLVSRVGEKPVVASENRQPGTTIEVRDLFARVPARRKHLGDPRVEGQRVHEIVMKHAVVRNDIGFRFVRDRETLVDCPPGQNPSERILALWGAEISRNLTDVDLVMSGINVQGFIVRPPITRGNRAREYFSVRRRPIEDIRLSKAVESAYGTQLMRGRFPICALNISIEVSRVDANVHPNKREVRVSDMEEVVEAVWNAVREALQVETAEPTSDLTEFIQADSHSTSESADRSPQLVPIQEQPTSTTVLEHMPLLDEGDFVEDEPLDLAALGGEFRIIGQFHNLYLLLEFPEHLVLIDQHAAHERILYEQLRREVNTGNTMVQELLEPIVLRLNASDVERILESAETLEKIGYSITGFGGKEILISTLPVVLGRIASEKELLAVIDRILDIGAESASEEFMDEVVKVTACHSAIRAGRALSNEEIRDLIKELAATPNLYYCAHGRPTIVRIKRDVLDARFGRTDPEAIARYRARHGSRKENG